VLDDLVGADGGAELLAGLDVLQRAFHDRLQRAEGIGRQRQRGQQRRMAAVSRFQRLAGAVIQFHRRSAPAIEQRISGLRHCTGRRFDPMPARRAVRRQRLDQQAVGDVGVQRHLAPALQPALAGHDGRCFVGEQAGCAHRTAAEQRQQARALRRVAVPHHDVGREEAGGDQRLVDEGPAGGLRQQRDRADAKAQSALLFAAGHAQPAQVGHLLPGLGAEAPLRGRQPLLRLEAMALTRIALRGVGQRGIGLVDPGFTVHRPSSALAMMLRWISLEPP